MSRFLESAQKLHNFLWRHHWDNGRLPGPDPGVRWNYRIGRFIKSYLPLPWKDDLLYMQAQTYWIWANYLLSDFTGKSCFSEAAGRTAETILEYQLPEGGWIYPYREWKDRILTVEGDFAALGLLAVYEREKNNRALQGAILWYEFLTEKMGFNSYNGGMAVNYFYQRGNSRIPNNSTLTLDFISHLYQVTGDKKYLKYWPSMVRFLTEAQLKTGELPYALNPDSGHNRIHFLCYQYNAFQLLDLCRAYDRYPDDTVGEIIGKLIEFLRTGLTDDFCSKYDCNKQTPVVHYYSAVLGAAFLSGSRFGSGDIQKEGVAVFDHLIRRQRKNGAFDFSLKNYGFLRDRRAYPRYLSMMLYHLLLAHREAA